MTEFADNNALSLIINTILFFLNKDFHFHMSFESDFTKYESFKKRLQAIKIKDISKYMNKTLKFTRESLIQTQKQIMKQINKHKKRSFMNLNKRCF